jgi:hypothetical protein
MMLRLEQCKPFRVLILPLLAEANDFSLLTTLEQGELRYSMDREGRIFRGAEGQEEDN